ncbi:MAG: glucosaminidase domain-containing protein [Candidatus Pacebacteria bacterium]|nr:glucosaminidase domain-containing protein [Candidatus Paceibacterota bacterium]
MRKSIYKKVTKTFTFFLILIAIISFLELASPKTTYAQIEPEVEYPEAFGKAPTTTLPDYIVYIYRFAVVSAGALAMLMLIIGGLRLMTSSGNPTKLEKGREQVLNAILGLIIILFSASILALINPNLLTLKDLNVKEYVYEGPSLKEMVEEYMSKYYPSSGSPSSSSGNSSDIWDTNAATTEEIENYLKTNFPKSPLIGKGNVYVETGKEYGVNPTFMLGIANAETSMGLQNLQSGNGLYGTNNPCGIACLPCKRYGSWEEGIRACTKNAGTEMYKRLTGIKEFRLRWCGYERDLGENPPVTLSDGGQITYECKNGNSKWEEEVGVIMNAF